MSGFTSDDYDEQELQADRNLISSALLLKKYHDYSHAFLNEYKDCLCWKWMFESEPESEIICHYDYAPYNIVYNDEGAVSIIDFETAHPGKKITDLAYAIYRFAPFSHTDNEKEIFSQIHRAKIFCRYYKATRLMRSNLVNEMIRRIENLIDFLLNASKSDLKYAKHMLNRHDEIYYNDLVYIKKNKDLIESHLLTE